MVSGRPIKPKALLFVLVFFSFSSQTGFRFGSIALRTEHSQAARVSPQLFRYILPRSPQALFFFSQFPRTGNLVDRYITPRHALRPKESKKDTYLVYVPPNVPTCQPACYLASLWSGPKNTFALIYLFYILFLFFSSSHLLTPVQPDPGL